MFATGFAKIASIISICHKTLKKQKIMEIIISKTYVKLPFELDITNCIVGEIRRKDTETNR